jgi:hypothetical protein
MERIRRAAATLVNIEATFLLALALYLLIRTATEDVTELDAIVAEIVFLILGATGLFFAGRGLFRQKRYGRGAIVMANLIALGVAYYMIDGQRMLWGVTLGTFAIATITLSVASIPRKSADS